MKNFNEVLKNLRKHLVDIMPIVGLKEYYNNRQRSYTGCFHFREDWQEDFCLQKTISYKWHGGYRKTAGNFQEFFFLQKVFILQIYVFHGSSRLFFSKEVIQEVLFVETIFRRLFCLQKTPRRYMFHSCRSISPFFYRRLLGGYRIPAGCFLSWEVERSSGDPYELRFP